MNRTMHVLAILLLILGCRASEPQEGVIDRVRVLTPERITVHRGVEGPGVVRLDIRDGFHIQANPVPLPYLIPTEFGLEETSLFSLGTLVYPPGVPYSLNGSPDTLQVYAGQLAIQYRLAAIDTVQPGNYEVRGHVTYQTCDDRMCFPPVKEPVIVPVKVR